MTSSYHRALPRSLIASILVHVALLASILLLAPPRRLPTPDEPSVNVEILSQAELQPPPQWPSQQLDLPKAAPVLPDAAPPPPEQPHPAEPLPGRVQAIQLLSGKVLADPPSRGAREALRQLGAADQIEQLCNLEAMEQVRRADPRYVPEFVVAYAMADPRRLPRGIDAGGAAFFSRQHWYRISFRCEVTADLGEVTALEFQAGDDIPQAEWESHNLFSATRQQD
jgi:hypothetical protein